MTLPRAVLMAFCVVPFLTTGAAGQDTGILGTWHGTSTCVDTEHFPACKDEVVVYEISPRGPHTDSVTVAADKIIGGARESMGELEYARQSDGSWVAEFQSPRAHVRVVLHRTNNHLVGTMTDVVSGRRVREIVLDRSS